ncbi:MAG TPA: NirA family protein [Planctomycetaceae bacterium]|nr:NirA family protein [Planctomycetaceae bacterium]
MSESGEGFSATQKQYLAGFTFGADVARAVAKLPVLSNSASPKGTCLQIGGSSATVNGQPIVTGPDRLAREAQDAVLARSGKLSKEEQGKREKNGLDVWQEIQSRANASEFPKGIDVFMTKYHGMFYVAPAQDSFMCRMRIAGGVLRGYQLRGVAEIANRCAGGYIDVTTRANLQLRQIPAHLPMEVLYGLRELDITCQGSGADNIRNCTASPLSGIDPCELIETIPLAKRMHHFILANRDLYGLPRKFNIAFEGGGRIGALDDTNDIGFRAVSVTEPQASEELPAGVYFQLTLGGITGHKDFARYTGVLLRSDECVEVAGAIVRVFVQSGDRTDRNKARLKYVLDAWGFDRFIAAVETELGRTLTKVDSNRFTTHQNEDRLAHVGVHLQKQADMHYVGVVLAVGRMSSEQAVAIADIADRYGKGEVRLTVWQNWVIPHIASHNLSVVQRELEAVGLSCDASSFRAGLVACTGNAGCKYAAADTKRHAMMIAERLESRFTLDQPINIHLTGCHHSCAQHYIGDIGLLACSVERGDDTVEGYHIHVGGGWGSEQAIGRLLFESVALDDCLGVIEQIVHAFVDQRSDNESFARFAARCSDETLKSFAFCAKR